MSIKTPESMLPGICSKPPLNYPDELQKDAIEISLAIKNVLEGCQTITIVGVALYILNNCLKSYGPNYQQYHVDEQAIAKSINKKSLHNVT